MIGDVSGSAHDGRTACSLLYHRPHKPMTFSYRELKVAGGTGVSHNHEIAAILEAAPP